MYRKILFCFFCLLIVTGCDGLNKKEKVIIRNEISCSTEDDRFNLILENGKIVKYIDSVDGELGQETIDILNDEFLVDVTDNDEALRIMSDGLKDLNGNCEKIFEQE